MYLIDYGCARSSKCFGALHARTHTLQPGEQRLSCGLCFQRLFIKHVPQFSNSKDGILQQSPIELILTLSLGFREERMCEGRRNAAIMLRSQNRNKKIQLAAAATGLKCKQMFECLVLSSIIIKPLSCCVR